jgi:hypothetical protein
MIIMTSYKFNSIHSLLSTREQLTILTSFIEKDRLVKIFSSFFFKYKNRFHVRVTFYFFEIRAFLYFVHLSSAYAYKIYLSSILLRVIHQSRTIF